MPRLGAIEKEEVKKALYLFAGKKLQL